MQWRIRIDNKIFTARLNEDDRTIHLNCEPRIIAIPAGRFARDILNQAFPDATIWPVTYTGHVTR